MSAQNRIRCLLAMLGTDVHTKGIRTLAQLLRDRGVEVIYLGEHNTIEGLVNSVIAEDVDLIGLSFSTAAYMYYAQDLMGALRKAEVTDVPVMLGGLIHKDDEAGLLAMGVKGIFGPGSTTQQILEYMQRTTGKSIEPASNQAHRAPPA